MTERSVGDALDAGRSRLARAGVQDPRGESERLLAYLLETDRGGLLVRRADLLGADPDMQYRDWIERRAQREPLQHLTGEQEFYGLSFKVDPRVLIPRPETEGLVDAALELSLPRAASVADLGTGSGCIAVVLADRRPDLKIFALDRSPAALDLARENAARHRVGRRIVFVEADLGKPPDAWRGRLDLVVCNPPYVTEDEWGRLEPEVRDHDPREALVAGKTGLEVYESLVPVAKGLLNEAGHLLVELGCGQAEAVRDLAIAADFSGIEIRPDLASIPRVLIARLSRTGDQK